MLSHNMNQKSDSNTQKKSISGFRRKLYFKNQGKEDGVSQRKQGGGQGQSLSVTRASNGAGKGEESFIKKGAGANLNKTVIGNEKISLSNASTYEIINDKAGNHNM